MQRGFVNKLKNKEAGEHEVLYTLSKIKKEITLHVMNYYSRKEKNFTTKGGMR